MSEIKTNKISPRKGTTQTIGDSGDTVSIACGATVTNAGTISTAGITGGTIDNTTGTISGLAGVIEWDTTAKTTAFTAESNKGYFVNTTSGAITVTFPASPTAGDVIGIKDYANTADTNIITIDPNGNNINGSSDNYLINIEGASGEFIYVDATRGWVLTDASKASDIAEAAAFITATGGCVTTCGDFKIHTFNSPGTFCVSSLGNGPTNPLGGPQNVDYLVVAGGAGAGGSVGAGGGAGGQRTSYPTCGGAVPVSVTGYPITVGGGGAGGVFGCNGTNGNNSVFNTITSAGGGGGAVGVPSCASNGVAGGSGGGGSGANNGSTSAPGGAGNTPPVSPPQGNSGGAGGTWSYGSGGGGGSGASGGNGGGGPGAPTFSGPGGNGVANSITGSSVTRGGGGGGGSNGTTAGTGGTGGGGDGAISGVGCAGAANTGGGGGGSAFTQTGAAGGSGVVIIRYKYQ